MPSPEATADGRRALELVTSVLAPYLHRSGVRVSPLGPAWSRDIDVHVLAWPPFGGLRAAGWLPLDGLLARLGRRTRGRWAVVDGDRVVGALDLHEGPPPDQVAAVVERARRRGQVRLREVVELRVLRRAGLRLPDGELVIGVAADIEWALGGAELEPWRTGAPRPCPAALPREATTAGADWLRRARRLGHRRVAVAISGVDGSGKSTLASVLAADLERAGVPTSRVWARPGMGGAWLRGLAAASKRILREDPTPGVRRVAADPSADVRSRRGVLGWLWSLLVTAAFLADVRRQHLPAQGVVVYDRHAMDAVATLAVLYPGQGQGLQRAAARRLLPRAALTVYLRVTAEEAAARKPGDTIGEPAVRRQLERYDELLERWPGALVLDGSNAPQALSIAVLRLLVAIPPPRPRRRARGRSQAVSGDRGGARGEAPG